MLRTRKGGMISKTKTTKKEDIIPFHSLASLREKREGKRSIMNEINLVRIKSQVSGPKKLRKEFPDGKK